MATVDHNDTVSSLDQDVVVRNESESRFMQLINEKEMEEEVEIEEVVDDESVHIIGRLYLGSIDAARNLTGIETITYSCNTCIVGQVQEDDVDAARFSHQSVRFNVEEYTKQQMTRTIIELEDSKDGDLLRRIPGILATLETIIVAGRSRSVSVVAAYMLVSAPKQKSVQDVVDQIRIIRPWVEINAHFMQDLHLFHAVLGSTNEAKLSAEKAALLTARSFPRLDFSANLVDKILQGTKTITMRLLSDIDDDHDLDLRDIFPYAVVTATTSSTCTDMLQTRRQFAYLRIDQIEIRELSAMDQTILHKSSFDSSEEILAVLKQFYPHVTSASLLLVMHFHTLYP